MARREGEAYFARTITEGNALLTYYLFAFMVTAAVLIAVMTIDAGYPRFASIVVAAFFATAGMCYILSIIGWISRVIKKFNTRHSESSLKNDRI